jgi:glucose/arabinose dehydrogenase
MLASMGRWILRGLGAVGLLAIAAFGACQLLPERFAVNVPLANVLFGSSADPPTAEQVGTQIRVPDGLTIGVFAELQKIRALRVTPAGDLLASVPREGRIVLLERDADGDGRSDGSRTILEGLNRPHGMDFHDGWLYVGETDAIGRVRFDAAARSVSGTFERVVTGLPGGGNHWTRTVRFGPDGWLYVSIGSSCNACLEEDARRAAMLRFRPDGTEGETFATGLRNSVGFDWRPDGGELYATDNGRDLLGDDFPPCELNRVVRGGFYGWPFANGARQPDPDLGEGRDQEIATSIPPAHAFRAHNAPLGMAFLQQDLSPSLPRGTAIVALHGSWNRTKKDGYKAVSLHFEADGTIRETDFLTGLLVDDEVLGRPVDVVQGPDAAVYVSDDYGGVVYRIAPASGAKAGGASGAAPAAKRSPAGDPLAGLSAEERDAAIARGAALYEANACYGCHEPARAQPGVVPTPLGALRDRYDIPGLVEFLAAPTPPMPAFPLADAERRDLAIHLLATR